MMVLLKLLFLGMQSDEDDPGIVGAGRRENIVDLGLLFSAGVVKQGRYLLNLGKSIILGFLQISLEERILSIGDFWILKIFFGSD